MDILLKYFPELTDEQKSLFSHLDELYRDWNSKMNLISRKDIENLYLKHILHSLSIARIVPFKPQADIMDLGTGGGFPGIPLAILFPKTNFLMVDSIGKKIRVVQDVISALGLQNAKAEQHRAEELTSEFDFVLNRAVAPLETLVYWTKNKFYKMYNHDLKNGLLCLKGGELDEELKTIPHPKKVYELSDYFEEDFFKTKKLVYVQMIP
jgi:16S rRNA (guanine527-N7)-methyltransferase